MLQLLNWQAGVVAKPLSCGVVRLKAKALPPRSDVLHSKSGFALSDKSATMWQTFYREGVEEKSDFF